MPRVMIICPATNRPVDTTSQVDSRAALDAIGVRTMSFLCGECGQKHSWSKDTAFLEGEQ
jgi:hypothetical protein